MWCVYVCLQESRDPRQLHWMFELLLQTPISGEAGAFGDARQAFIVWNIFFLSFLLTLKDEHLRLLFMLTEKTQRERERSREVSSVVTPEPDLC